MDDNDGYINIFFKKFFIGMSLIVGLLFIKFLLCFKLIIKVCYNV